MTCMTEGGTSNRHVTQLCGGAKIQVTSRWRPAETKRERKVFLCQPRAFVRMSAREVLRHEDVLHKVLPCVYDAIVVG